MIETNVLTKTPQRIGRIIAGLALAGAVLGACNSTQTLNEDEAIEVVVPAKPLRVTEEFQGMLRSEDAVAVILVNRSGQLSAYTLPTEPGALQSDLQPLDLCDVPSDSKDVPSDSKNVAETCKIELSPSSLVTLATSSCYTCPASESDTGTTLSCHAAGAGKRQMSPCEPSRRHNHLTKCSCRVP